jgi:outer membrane protein OmpA-like peptidoglycan-associated protein
MSLSFSRFSRLSFVFSLLLCFASVLATAQETSFPKLDLFGGYAWTNPGDRVGTTKLPNIPKGFGINATWNVNRFLGFSLDGSGHFNDVADVGTIMVGPRFIYRNNNNALQPFAHGLVGLHRMSVAGLGNDNGIGLRTGGGLDYPFSRLISWRVIQADYVWGHHNFAGPARSTNLAGAEVRTGIVFKFGGAPPPPPLGASCSAQPTQVMAGEPVTVTATASNILKNHTVGYEFRSTGGQVKASNNAATIDTTGLAPGSYTVTGNATDAKIKTGGTANCSATFTVKAPPPPPQHPPTISCSPNPATVRAGDPVTVTCTGQSPDSRPLSYDWKTTGGRLMAQQNQATLDTAGASAGPIRVTTTVTDDRGLNATTTTTVNVEVPPPPPQASKLNEIQFKDKRRASRVDNEAKAILDDVALRLQREPDAKAVIVGQFEQAERNGPRLGQERAVNTMEYLVKEKGIDPSRLELRTGNAGSSTAEVWIVPPGASFDQAGTTVFNASAVAPPKPVRRKR